MTTGVLGIRDNRAEVIGLPEAIRRPCDGEYLLIALGYGRSWNVDILRSFVGRIQ